MIDFIKMHGCGNDFLVIDARKQDVSHLLKKDTTPVARVCDRHFGVGADQLIVIAPAKEADAEMKIRNADGTVAGMCGNAARCVASILLKEKKTNRISLLVGDRVLTCSGDETRVSVDMGLPKTSWKDIPLNKEQDASKVELGYGMPPAFCVSMGNPHAVLFVKDSEAIDIASIGPDLERHEKFPSRANIEFVSLNKDGALRTRVWERGAGITLACGSGACAVGYAAYKKGIAARKSFIHMDGGVLEVSVRETDGHIVMAGPVAYVFSGQLP